MRVWRAGSIILKYIIITHHNIIRFQKRLLLLLRREYSFNENRVAFDIYLPTNLFCVSIFDITRVYLSRAYIINYRRRIRQVQCKRIECLLVVNNCIDRDRDTSIQTLCFSSAVGFSELLTCFPSINRGIIILLYDIASSGYFHLLLIHRSYYRYLPKKGERAYKSITVEN